MQEELTVRVEHPELPAIRWNEAEVQQNLTEMQAASPSVPVEITGADGQIGRAHV